MGFRDYISGAFGEVDSKFSLHPLDRDRAIELIKICSQNNVSMNELLVAVEDYLNKKSCGAHHIAEQLKEVEENSKVG